jgi:uncharacterized membrane protein
MSTLKSSHISWGILTAGASVGAVASFIQIIERIQFAEQPLQKLSCDVNSVFSCSSVFDGWQSSVFGFSNAIMCLAFFGVSLGVGLSGLFGSQLAKNLRLIMQFFAIFFLGFGAWYLQQSAFSIGALCIFCIFCYSGVIAMNWAWLRINYNDLPLLSSQHKTSLKKVFSKGIDTFAWLLWALCIAGMFIIAFR